MNKTKTKLPNYFDKVLWSHNIKNTNPDNSYREIIVNSVNYGDLKHWRWIVDYYGKDKALEVVRSVSGTEIRPGAKKLALILFNNATNSHQRR